MIKGRDGNRGSSSSSSGYSADLLVCFPPRTHLALTPKPISSPSRHSDSTNRRPHHRRQHSKLSGRKGGGHGSPVLWAKQASSKNRGGEEIDEPTSPKVTCAGQIKVRPSKCGGKGKNWRSVMEEIERMHSSKPQSKFFGVKKDVMGFLTCLRNIRFDFRCFGDFRHADVTSDDEEDEDDDGEEEEEEEEEEEDPKTAFSKWFMVLQEEQSNKDKDNNDNKCVLENSDAEPAVPPPNALLLMRCRSAPAKSWLEERMQAKTEQENRVKQQEEETERENRERQQEEETERENREKREEEQEMSVKDDKNDLRSLVEEEKMDLVLMRYDTDYYRLSSDIAKETWVVGGIQDPLSRSRSWRS